MKRLSWLAVGLVFGAITAGVVARFLWLERVDQSVDWPATFTAISDITQTIAVVVAGVWTYRLFVKQRSDRIRAELGLSASVVEASGENVLVRAVLEIKNVGSVELCPHKAYVRVQGIVRSRSVVPQSSTGNGVSHTPHTSVEEWPDILTSELQFENDDRLTLEPGEAERYPMDFMIPGDYTTVQVRVIVRADRDEKGIYWDETSIVQLHPSGPDRLNPNGTEDKRTSGPAR